MTKPKTDYSVPKGILSMKPAGTCVKKLHGRYYVYKVKTVKKADGRWGTKTVGLIGRIDPSLGFVTRGDGVAAKGPEIVEFGQYFLAEAASASEGEGGTGGGLLQGGRGQDTGDGHRELRRGLHPDKGHG